MNYYFQLHIIFHIKKPIIKINLNNKFRQYKYPIDEYKNEKYKFNFIKRELVEYIRINKTKYNDIYKFLKSGIIPKYYDSIKNSKRRQKKINDFRKEVKNKYKLENDILYYKYYIPNKIVKNYIKYDIKDNKTEDNKESKKRN